MCYNMKRFEKVTEEKEQLPTEQELNITVGNQPEIIVNPHTKTNRQEKSEVN